MIALITVGHRNDPTQGFNQPHVVRIYFRHVPNFVNDQLHRGIQQEQTKQVKHIRPGVDGDFAQQNKHEPEGKRQHNSDEQYLLLIFPWHLETAHDEGKHKQVVDAKCFFHNIAVEEFQPMLMWVTGLGPCKPQENAEEAGQGHINQRPNGRFFEGRFVRCAHMGIEVENEQADY